MSAFSALSRRTLPVLAAVLIFNGVAASAIAQNPAPSPTWSQEDTVKISNEVQKRLARLTYYGVFDWLTFGFHGKTIFVRGYASRPILKSAVDSALKGIPGVASIDNQIEVLPNSPNDDQIRAATYNRIFTQGSLRKYNANQGNIRQAMGPGLNVGGVTNNPPIGFHAIHIIVKNGNITLFGVVNNDSDKSIAGMQANSTPGAFSVDNDLIVEGPAPKKEK